MRRAAILLCVTVGACALQPAIARWKPQYASAPLAVQKWFSSQHNANGQWCCDQADGHAYYGAYT